MTTNNTVTAIAGIKVGHYTDLEGITGCTVILCPPGTVGAVDVRGGAPGTRETDVLAPTNYVSEVNAVVLAGGSAYGLGTVDGVMRFCKEQEIGFIVAPDLRVPIVPAAILFDLTIGDPNVFPTADDAYKACQLASDLPVEQGSVGAGTGARIGSIQGNEYAFKGGIGSACIDLGDGLKVAAIAVVNPVGDVIDEQGAILAGMGSEGHFFGMVNIMKNMAQIDLGLASSNTVIGCVVTNAILTKTEARKIAEIAHDGLARAINPAHTLLDGDTIFCLATGEIKANSISIGTFAAEAFSQAIRNGVRNAVSLAEVRAFNN
ncbi:P1 family peptidase [Anaerolineales bacterium]